MINKVFTVLVISCVLPLLGLAKISIADKINEHQCYKNILHSYSRAHSESTFNRATHICQGATSSAPSECYESILHDFTSLPSEKTLDRIASLCTAKNLINATYLAHH